MEFDGVSNEVMCFLKGGDGMMMRKQLFAGGQFEGNRYKSII
jgi:hypothetical protein